VQFEILKKLLTVNNVKSSAWSEHVTFEMSQLLLDSNILTKDEEVPPEKTGSAETLQIQQKKSSLHKAYIDPKRVYSRVIFEDLCIDLPEKFANLSLRYIVRYATAKEIART
jgi:hypothetical protein